MKYRDHDLRGQRYAQQRCWGLIDDTRTGMFIIDSWRHRFGVFKQVHSVVAPHDTGLTRRQRASSRESNNAYD
jgi:hypothetical protein